MNNISNASQSASQQAQPDKPDGLALRLARGALRLYPAAWRARYAEEVTLVLRASHVTGWTLIDLALGALDAHFHRELLPVRLLSMAHRLRTSDIVIFCGYMLYALAWAAMTFVRDPLPEWERATAAHPTLLLAYDTMDLAGLVATLAFLAGGLPILWSVIAQTLRRRQPRVIFALLAPVALVVIFVVFALLTVQYSTTTVPHTQNGQLTPLAFALQMALLLLFLLTFVGGIAAMSYAVAHSEVSERLLRYTLIPGAVVTLALIFGLLTTVALSVVIATEAPEVASSFGQPIVIIMMLAGVALAVSALWRGLRAARGGAGA